MGIPEKLVGCEVILVVKWVTRPGAGAEGQRGRGAEGAGRGRAGGRGRAIWDSSYFPLLFKKALTIRNFGTVGTDT